MVRVSDIFFSDPIPADRRRIGPLRYLETTSLTLRRYVKISFGGGAVLQPEEKQRNVFEIRSDRNARVRSDRLHLKKRYAEHDRREFFFLMNIQLNLSPFSSVLANPLVFNLSEGTDSSGISFLVPFLLFQGGAMDLSKVGEKILSSIRCVRSLALLPSASDRPEVIEISVFARNAALGPPIRCISCLVV